MKGRLKRIVSMLLAAAMTVSLTACGGGNTAATTAAQGQTEAQQQTASAEKIVNVGVTNTLESINPLLLNGGEINKYATGLMFLPLMELDKDLNFQPMLADSITTEDNRNFIVHIDEDAVWSDGTPVTAEDVEYTFLRLASPVIANYAMMYYVFEGVNDEGFVEEGAESVEGVKVIDEKTIQFTTKDVMSLNTFMNSYARYLLTLPKHKIEGIAEAELSTAEWFNKPDVVSGPYMVTGYDVNHYISYTANENFWMGAPKIEKLNIRILDGSQIYAGLQSGEIDITQHTMTDIPITDYDSIKALDNVEVIMGDPITNQSMFIQTANVQDVKVRQAMLCAIDREKILNELMKGHGEIVDGFLSSASPYYSPVIGTVSYDPEKAKELLNEAGWDGSDVLQFYVNSGDKTFVNAATIIAAQWQAVGIKSEIKTVDFATLMSVSGTKDYDVLAVQYTYPPVDPYADMAWLLGGEGSWTGYSKPEINAALAGTQTTTDKDELQALYTIVNSMVQEEVPMISAYVISALGAKNKRLIGAEPSVYGFFNDVHNWDIAQ